MVCGKCGATSEAGARFCSRCGTPLAEAGEAARELRKTITVVFTDLVDSTSMAERLDPEVLSGVLSRYFEKMRIVVERHGGTVEKFIGDAVVAMFGVTDLHEDDAVRAVRAAIEMRDAVENVNVELEARYGVRLRTRT